jgi:hypothetical protein
MHLLFISVFLCLFGCKTKPIKEVARPRVPICLQDVENPNNFICGFDDKNESFNYEAKNVIGTTAEDYLEASKYVDNLENYIRFLQRRRCKK